MTLGSGGPPVMGLYPIIDAAGRRPNLLTDFIGDVTVTVAMDGRPCLLTGVGGLTDRGLEFQQKNAADADVQVWAITEDDQATFWAEPLTAG
jgi:hypothetical protein